MSNELRKKLIKMLNDFVYDQDSEYGDQKFTSETFLDEFIKTVLEHKTIEGENNV